jgi:hypothetical protein
MELSGCMWRRAAGAAATGAAASARRFVALRPRRRPWLPPISPQFRTRLWHTVPAALERISCRCIGSVQDGSQTTRQQEGDHRHRQQQQQQQQQQ